MLCRPASPPATLPDVGVVDSEGDVGAKWHARLCATFGTQEEPCHVAAGANWVGRLLTPAQPQGPQWQMVRSVIPRSAAIRATGRPAATRSTPCCKLGLDNAWTRTRLIPGVVTRSPAIRPHEMRANQSIQTPRCDSLTAGQCRVVGYREFMSVKERQSPAASRPSPIATRPSSWARSAC